MEVSAMSLPFVDVERGGEITTRVLIHMSVVQDKQRQELYSAMTRAGAGVVSRHGTGLLGVGGNPEWAADEAFSRRIGRRTDKHTSAAS